jgi:hypothetical protein
MRLYILAYSQRWSATGNSGTPIDRTEYILMDRPKKSRASIDQPRRSAHLTVLRDNLGLNEQDWQRFLRHAHDGFVDYEKATSVAPDLGLRLRDVPEQWWGSPDHIGYVFLRVARRAEATLAVPVGWYFFCEN